MSRIFISHSSRDNAAAVALNDWLRTNGWDEVFLDLDPERGIKAGERWERALHEAADRCQVVVFLVSHNWLESKWCGKEFDLAAKLNKRMFGVLIDDFAIRDISPRFTDTWQFTNLSSGQDHCTFRAVIPPDDREVHVTFSLKGLRRLKAGLQAAGLDPRFFGWPPHDDLDRSPYSGLPPMAEADAGIFFGREADIVRGLDELRGLARKAPPRLFVIEGASGCGKSSFLRAGLIPRLKRDDRNYLVLPPIRPEQAAIDGARGFVTAVTTGFAEAGLPRDRADLRALVTAPDELELALADLAARSRVPAMPGETEPPPPAIVIPVDQAEELFQSAGREQGRWLLELLATLGRSKVVRVVIVFTIRTDDYEPLQTSAELEAMPQHIFGLAPIPIGRLGTIIQGPARRLTESKHTERTLTIEPALVARLLRDLQEGASADVMPLCAFILERLWREYGGDGKLELAEYESTERGLGGIRGAIEGAAAAAFAEPQRDPAIPADPVKRAALLRRAMIPALAAIDPDTRTPRRRVARLSEIPEEARALVERLVAARLLSKDWDPETKERSVEPAHEALLRQWSLMETWLDEDARDLLLLDGVERAARDWDENGRNVIWLVHTGGRLEDAERLRQRSDFAPRLAGAPGAYLDACRITETAIRDKELADARRFATEQQARAKAEAARADEEKARAAAETAGADEARRRVEATRVGLVATIVLLVASCIAAFWAWNSSKGLELANGRLAQSNQNFEDRARIARNNEAAALTALSSLALDDGRPIIAAKLALASWPRTATDTGLRLHKTVQALGAATARLRERVRLVLQGDVEIRSVAWAPNGGQLAIGLADGTVRLWDVSKGVEINTLVGHEREVRSAVFSPDGKVLVTGSFDGTILIWDLATGTEAKRFHIEMPGNLVENLAFSPDGAELAVGLMGNVLIWDFASGVEIRRITGFGSTVSVAFSPDGSRLATGSRGQSGGGVWIWDANDWSLVLDYETPGDSTGGDNADVAYSDDGKYLVIQADVSAFILDAETGDLTAKIEVPDRQVGSVALSSSGHLAAYMTSSIFENSVGVFDLATGKMLYLLEGQALFYGARFIAFSLDGSMLVTGSTEGPLQVWDTATAAVIGEIEGDWAGIDVAGISTNSTYLAIGNKDGTVVVVNTVTGRQVTRLEGGEGSVNSVAFSANGTRLAIAAKNGVRVWDTATWADVGRMAQSIETTISSLSPDGNRVALPAYGMEQGAVRIWNPVAGGEPIRIGSLQDEVISSDFSPDGSRLALASATAVAIYDVATGDEIVRHDSNGEIRITTDVAFSPDGRYLAAGQANGLVRIWDLSTGKAPTLLHAADDSGSIGVFSNKYVPPMFKGLDFSPDSTLLATGSPFGRPRIWDVSTGAEVARFPVHNGAVEAVQFHPDGDRLVSASQDGTARIWRVTFAPYDNYLRLGIPPGDIFKIACTWLPWVNGQPDHALSDIAGAYGIEIDEPICNYDSGYDPPLPVTSGAE